MRDKKMFISAILLTTVMLFVGGCGIQAEPVSADMADTVKDADTEESLEQISSPTALPDDYGIEVTIEPTEDVIIIVDETEVEETDVEETDVGEEEIVEDDTGTEEAEVVVTEAPKTNTGGSTSNGSTSNGGSASNGSTSNGGSSGSTNTGGSSGSTNTGGSSNNAQPAEPTPAPATPAPAAPTPTPQPVHTHNWLEHTATKQVWVPNIVVVDDYEDRVTGHVDDVAICGVCGYSTTSGSDIESHIVNHVLAGEGSHFTIQAGYDIIERVIVGSHEEDHGHTETQTYVDYYYCECGERK